MRIEILGDKVIIDGIEYIKATSSIETNNIENKGYIFSRNSLNRLKGVSPKLVELAKKVITISPFDFLIVAGLRTAEEQNKLYQQGRTIPGPKVTNCDGYKNKSRHQAKSDGYSHAIDIAIYDPNIPGNIDWNNINKYRAVVDVFKREAIKNGFEIEWGGDWTSFKDYPHIQIKEMN